MSLKSIIAAALLLVASPLYAADLVNPPGSNLAMEPLPGFEPADGMTGFVNRQIGASILFVEMPPEAYADLVKEVTAEALATQGVTVTEERTEISGYAPDHFVVLGTQSANNLTYDKYILVADLAEKTAFVTVNMPAQAGVTREQVLASLATLQLAGEVVDLRARLSFSVEETPRFAKDHTVLNQTLALADDPNASPPNMFVVARSLDVVQFGSMEQLSRMMLDSYEQMTFSTFSDPTREEIAGFNAVVQTAEGVWTYRNQKMKVWQAVIAGDESGPAETLRIMGIAHIDEFDALLPEFRQMADSLKVLR